MRYVIWLVYVCFLRRLGLPGCIAANGENRNACFLHGAAHADSTDRHWFYRTVDTSA